MPLSRIISGQRRTIAKLSPRKLGALRQLRTLKVMHGDELRLVANFAPPMSAAASPGHVSGFESGIKPAMVRSSSCTAVVTGGQSPYSYSWAILSGDTGVAPTAPSNATTQFQKVLYQASTAATARCTVTDALGTTATCDVSITLTQSDGGF